MRLDREYALNADKTKVVEPDSPEAAWTLGGEGSEISDDDARKYGLLPPLPEQEESKPPKLTIKNPADMDDAEFDALLKRVAENLVGAWTDEQVEAAVDRFVPVLQQRGVLQSQEADEKSEGDTMTNEHGVQTPKPGRIGEGFDGSRFDMGNPETGNPATEGKKPKEHPKGDDLTQIKGVGPEIAKVLNERGILTFADLKKASDEDLLAVPGLGESLLKEIRSHKAR